MPNYEPNYNCCQSHCCINHNCKYGEDGCPVITGKVKQDHLCEYCLPGYGDYDCYSISLDEKDSEFVAGLVKESFKNSKTKFKSADDIVKEALDLYRDSLKTKALDFSIASCYNSG